MAEKSNWAVVDDFRRAIISCDGVEEARAAVLARMRGPGEVVVPREPTPEMMEAYDITGDWPWRDINDELQSHDCARASGEIYAAMLAARPNGGNDG